MARFFFSHARADATSEVAKWIQGVTRHGGHELWIDRPDIAAGLRYKGAIDRALGRSRGVVVLWTPLSVRSEWVTYEARVGARRQKIIPLLYRVRPTDLPPDLRSHQAIDLSNASWERAGAELVRRMGELAGTPLWWRALRELELHRRARALWREVRRRAPALRRLLHQRPLLGQRLGYLIVASIGALLALIILPAFCGSDTPEASTELRVKTQIEIRLERGDTVDCRIGEDGGRIEIEGQAMGLRKRGLVLVLYLNPNDIRAQGWFLQLPPDHGIVFPESTYAWTGAAQLGSREYPPDGNEVIQVAVVALPAEEGKRRCALARSRPNTPIPELPRVRSSHRAVVKDLRVRIIR